MNFDQTAYQCNGLDLLAKFIVEYFCQPALKFYFLDLFEMKNGRRFDPETDGFALFHGEDMETLPGYMQNCFNYNDGYLRVNEYLVTKGMLRKMPFLTWATFFKHSRVYSVHNEKFLDIVTKLINVRNGVYERRRTQDGGGITPEVFQSIFRMVGDLLLITDCLGDCNQVKMAKILEIKSRMAQQATRVFECAKLEEYFDNHEQWLKTTMELARSRRGRSYGNERYTPTLSISSSFVERSAKNKQFDEQNQAQLLIDKLIRMKAEVMQG